MKKINQNQRESDKKKLMESMGNPIKSYENLERFGLPINQGTPHKTFSADYLYICIHIYKHLYIFIHIDTTLQI